MQSWCIIYYSLWKLITLYISYDTKHNTDLQKQIIHHILQHSVRRNHVVSNVTKTIIHHIFWATEAVYKNGHSQPKDRDVK